MKFTRVFLALLFVLLPMLAVFAQSETPETTDFSYVFISFGALVAAIPLVTEFLKRLLNKSSTTPDIVVQILSWIVGILLTLFGYFANLGFLSEVSFWGAVLYGVGASLAANGVADTKLVQWIFSLFTKNK